MTLDRELGFPWNNLILKHGGSVWEWTLRELQPKTAHHELPGPLFAEKAGEDSKAYSPMCSRNTTPAILASSHCLGEQFDFRNIISTFAVEDGGKKLRKPEQ